MESGGMGAVREEVAGAAPESALAAVARRYQADQPAALLTGVQAIGRLLVEQHALDGRQGQRTVSFVSGYRGSPLGGLDRTLQAIPDARAAHGIHLVPGLNEELAATAVWGSQAPLPDGRLTHDGVVGVWYGKAPGVDRAGDAIRHGNMQGAHPRGGVLVLAGDDPSAKSSTLPCASERTLAAYNVPVLYPRSSEEVITLGLLGVAMSRASGLWIGMKIATDVADGLWSVSRSFGDVALQTPAIEWEGRPWRHVQAHAATLPWTRDAEEQLVGPRWRQLLAIAEANPLNVVELDPRRARLGIVAPGKTYDDLREALRLLRLEDRDLSRLGVRLLRLGMVHPLPPETIRRFAQGLETIVVVEEKRSFVETQLREILYGPAAPAVLGKLDREGRPLFAAYGALSPEAIAAALRRALPFAVAEARPPHGAAAPLDASRTSYFCSGCPHNRSTVVPEGSFAGAGIGCHAMALRMPQNAGRMTGITQMGGEGAQWIGQALFTPTGHIFQNLGDGTYFHSGQLAVQACIAAGVNITFKLLYNSAVAMTGGQPADGALPVPELTRKLTAEGVRKIIVCADEPRRYRADSGFSHITDVWPRERLEEAQLRLRDIPGVTVLIYDQVCAAESRRLRKRAVAPARTTRLVIQQAVCEGCGDCGVKSNCLSVQPVETEFGRKTRIDHASCNLDYSCLDGECPSFLAVELKDGKAERVRPDPPAAPEPKRTAAPASLLLAGIGGTGVVTVNQVLAAAAQADGLEVAGLDQTGLSQKAGPVSSHLRISPASFGGNRLTPQSATAYLAFDALVGAQPDLLTYADPAQTVAVVSTSRTATGAEVRFADERAPEVEGLIARIGARTQRCATLDTVALAQQLFGSPATANMLLTGLAYQLGALPMSAASIEAAIATNGVAVADNVAAFRWGRALAVDPELAERLAPPRPPAPADGAALLQGSELAGETRRLAGLRAAHLEAYQSRDAAHAYLAAVEAAWAAERRLGRRTAFSEGVARGLHRLWAYKDEYEVARLLTDASTLAQVEAELGPVQRISFRLRPPALRNFGLRRKVALGPAWRPLLKGLAALKGLRGTPLDLFGRDPVRQLERALLRDGQAMVRTLTEALTSETYDRAVAAVSAIELVRGFETVKARGARAYLARLEAILPAGPMPEPRREALTLLDHIEAQAAQPRAGPTEASELAATLPPFHT